MGIEIFRINSFLFILFQMREHGYLAKDVDLVGMSEQYFLYLYLRWRCSELLQSTTFLLWLSHSIC